MSDQKQPAELAKTYSIDPFVRWSRPIRVYVSPSDNCLRIRQDDQEIVLAPHAAESLKDAMLCAIHAHENGVRDGDPGFGEEGFAAITEGNQDRLT